MSILLRVAGIISGGVAALPEFVAAGAVATGANPTVAMPSGIQEGDLLIILGTSGSSFATPSGWTEAVNQSGTNPRLWMAYKFAGASESSVAVTNSNSRTAAAVVAFRNVSASDTSGTLNTTLTTTSLSTTAANDLVVSLFGDSDSSAVKTWTDPASTLRAIAYGGDGVEKRPFLLVYEIKNATGATSTRTAIVSGSTANSVSYAHSFKN